MEDYRSTAIKRGRINTPSYAQVSQPIYKDAKYRWINYKDYLEKYSDKIEPWIDEFGYEKLF
jgi:uridine kinase